MPKTMKVEVRQENIDIGQRGSSYCCPIALSLKESLKTDEFLVRNNYIISKKTFKFYDLEINVINFISDFDAGNSVKPFKFVLRER